MPAAGLTAVAAGHPPVPAPPGACDDWHAVSPEQALAMLGSRPAGLSPDEVAERLAASGPNELPRWRPEGRFKLIRRELGRPLIVVLLVAAAVSALLAHWVELGVIAGVALANVWIAVFQELRAGCAVEALSGLSADRCTVVRAGVPGPAPARELVPGDIVVLEAGDPVPADARVLAARRLLANEAPLTGRSEPVEKLDRQTLAAETPVRDRSNMLYAGTQVSAGKGRALVVKTGSDTEFGRTSQLSASANRLATPLTRTIAGFSKRVTAAIVVLAAVAFAAAVAWGYDAVDGLRAGVALTVAAIPEGWPAIVAITLAVGVRRMAARDAVIRRLPAVETLGSMTVVCADKTGTLTHGEMVVSELFAGSRVEVTGTRHDLRGGFRVCGIELDTPPEAAVRLLKAGLLCSDAELVRSDGRTIVVGDPMEGAIIAAAAEAGIDRRAAERRRPRVDELPFEPERRLMATRHDDSPRHGRLTILKGAPEAVIPRCASLGRTDERPEADLAEAMAARGLRVLAVAVRSDSLERAALSEEELGDGYRLLGLIGLLDPPREDAARAVAACRRAGIKVAMITGDHPRTAAAVATQTGIDVSAGTLICDRPGRLSGARLDQVAHRTAVFARATPEDKLRLVHALQRRGEVVAMTGDGVNDAPALKQADIGIALGLTGTDMSKQAADMILRDDNFATIEAAVAEGRRVYDNTIKSLVFILPTNAGEALLILGALAAGLTLPLLPVQVLWINLVTAVALALPLAVEAREPDVMRRAPRRQDEPVLGRGGVERVVLVATLMLIGGMLLFELEQRWGASEPQARASVVTAIVLVESLYLFGCRSLRHSAAGVGLFSNPWVYAGVTLALALQMLLLYAPFMHELFGTAPIGPRQWLAAAAVAAPVVPLVALHKRIIRRSRAAPSAAAGRHAPSR